MVMMMALLHDRYLDQIWMVVAVGQLIRMVADAAFGGGRGRQIQGIVRMVVVMEGRG